MLQSTRCNNNSFFLLVCILFFSIGSLSSQKLGCRYDKDLCGFYEFCNEEDNFLGECQNMLATNEDDLSIKLNPRSEEAYNAADNSLIEDAPIRIHKYNLDKMNLYDQEQEQEDDYSSSKDDQELDEPSNDVLDRTLDIIQQNQQNNYNDQNEDDSNEDDSSSDEDDQYNTVDDYDVISDKHTREDDSSSEELSSSSQFDPDLHLSLLGLRKKRLSILTPNNNDDYAQDYYENVNYDDEPVNIDELLKTLADVSLSSSAPSSLNANKPVEVEVNEENEADPSNYLNYVSKKNFPSQNDDSNYGLSDYDFMNNVPSPIDSKLNDALNEDYSETLDDLNETEMSSHQIGKELDEIENNLDQIQSELIKNENVQQQADYDDDDDDGGEDDDDVAANDYDDIGSNEILSKPLVHESQGVDKYGNQFHEKDISYSGHSDSHPDNRFESFYKTLNVVNDNASPEQMQQQQHENEPTIDDYFVHEPESIHDLESNGGVNIIDEIDHVLSGNPAEALLNAYMNNPAESEMPPRTYPSFEQKHEDVRSPEENNGQNDYLNDIFGVEPLVKVEYLSSPKEMPSTVDMSSPLTRMKIGLHYNMQMPPQSPPASETFESLRSDMNNANKLMQEINSILDASSNSANPVEDVINAFMTHHGELDRKQASAPLPSFKQKLQENVDLAKKSMLDLHINPRIVNPNIFAEEEIVDTEQKHHSTKHFNTYDYFEPVFVDSKANDDEKKANIKDLESNLNKEQDEFIKSLTPKTDQLDQVYEVASDANMENDSKHSALNALLKNTQGKYDYVDSSYIFIELDKTIKDYEAVTLLGLVAAFASIPIVAFQDISVQNNLILFKINDPIVNSTFAIEKILEHQLELKEKGYNVISCGLGRDDHRIKIKKQSDYIAIVTIILCASIASTLLIIFAIFLIRRRVLLRSKLVDALGNTSIHKPSGGGGKFDDEERLVQRSSSGRQNTKPWYSFIRREQVNETTPKKDYQDLCRARMHGNKSPQQQPSCETPNMVTPGLNASQKTTNCTINSTPIRTNEEANESNRSSTSSWSEEPISSVNMDITTGHVILSYMEEHLNDKNRLGKEWKELENYEADQKSTYIGSLPAYMIKNRYSNIIAYDHNRVKIGQNTESDYINANFIMDDDPKNPVYIATQGPLMTTTNDFWQMVWEQGSVVIVSLCRTVESGTVKCNQYWPVNGSEVHDKFEVNLVSEHVWCEDYLVRNFFLKNCETNQTRTVTQFHFLTWPENGVPQSIKSVLDFRRKVNKSYKSKSCPIIVHCSDGIGRAGTYIMIDMVLNKIARGAKEIDLAATLEYLRDQRPGMIKTKNQFEFSFAVVTEEVQNMLKALNP